MADRQQPVKAASCTHASSRTTCFPHLKPLSLYSRRVFCKAANPCSLSPPLSPDSPPWSIKVEFANSRASVGRKRRLDDSCPDGEYNNPPKKPCLDNSASPDSACDFRQVKLVSSQSSSVVLDGIKRIDQMLSDHESLGLGWLDWIGKNNDQSSVSFPAVHSSSPVILHNKGSVDGIALNYDVDEILCLSPIDSLDVSADGQNDFIQSCQTYEERLAAEDVCSSGQKQGKAECSLGKDAQTESDEGYVTKSFDNADSKDMTESEVTKSDQFLKSYQITVPNLSNGKTPTVSIPVVSTPLNKLKPSPVSSPNLNFEKDNWSSVCEALKAFFAISRNANKNVCADETEALPAVPFSNVKESKAGHIVHEGGSKSSVCHNQEKRSANQVNEDKDVRSVGQQQVALEVTVMFREKTDAEDGFRNTLPLPVESKVVLPNTQEVVGAPAHQQLEKIAASEGPGNVIRNVPRPVVLYREKDWEKEKAAYVDSVTRHITNNGEDGVMTELLHLMNTIANQNRGSSGRKWQHPADLTRRNYRLRSLSRLLSLDEWQNLNYRYHRRFAKVPQVFKRNPVICSQPIKRHILPQRFSLPD